MKIRKNIVMRMISASAIMCTAISMAVFPSYAVDASRINSKGNIVLEDGDRDVALYAADADYLYNEISNLYQELPEISNSSYYGTARKSGLNSKGIIDYANGTVVIDSSDLIFLADEIDSLEAEFKANTVAALNAMGTFFLEDGSINHVDENLEEAAALSFETIYEGIKQSQSVDHLAPNVIASIEDNLSKGTAAWVNGELVIGNGADNDAYYNKGVSDGYNDGYKQGESDGYSDGYKQGESDGYNKGYKQGESDGYDKGYKQGESDGYNKGVSDGYSDGYKQGESDGYDKGYKQGESDGYDKGYKQGESDGYNKGVSDGYSDGYNKGVSDGHADVIANPSGYGITADSMIDALPFYQASANMNNSTYYMTAPSNGTCTLVGKAAFSCREDRHSVANDFICTIYRGNTTVARYSVNEHTDNYLAQEDFYYAINFNVPIDNCTAGESLRIEVFSGGLDATWIMGIK